MHSTSHPAVRIVLVCALIGVWGGARAGVAGPGTADSAGHVLVDSAPAQSADTCPAPEPFENRVFGDYAFEVPPGWRAKSEPGRVLFGWSDACSFELAVRQAPGSFSFDPTKAVDTFFSMRSDLKPAGGSVDVMLGGAIQAKRFAAQGVFGGQVYTADVVATSRGTEFFWAAFVTSPAAESARARLGDRLLRAVRVVSTTEAPFAPGVSASRPSAPHGSDTTDVSNPVVFSGGAFTFSYPRGWAVQLDVPDQNNTEYRRVQLLSPGGEVIEARYKRIPEGRVVGDSAREADQLARFAVPGTSYLAGYDEVFPGAISGRTLRMAWHTKHADPGSIDLITAPLSEGQHFASIAYRYDNKRISPKSLADLTSFRLVLTSFRFTP